MMNDMVEFVSLNPYRLIICGRLNDIFSPFGEHMLPIQTEQAMAKTSTQANSIIRDFLIVPDFEASRYRCYIDFELAPTDIKTFQLLLDQNLCSKTVIIMTFQKQASSTSLILFPFLKGFSQHRCEACYRAVKNEASFTGPTYHA